MPYRTEVMTMVIGATGISVTRMIGIGIGLTIGVVTDIVEQCRAPESSHPEPVKLVVACFFAPYLFFRLNRAA